MHPLSPHTVDLQRVITGDYCIGCGACAAQQPDSIRLTRSENGLYRPELTPDADLTSANRVCPFSAASQNEDELAQTLFADAPYQSDTLGRYRDIWAGHVAEPPYRANGSSGGMGSWLLAEALQQGVADHVIHVRAAQDGALFAYTISSDVAGVQSGAKSRYYPIELSQIIAHVRANPGRYAFVGIPCMLKALRNICAEDAQVAERITFTVGLFCGHMKTADFAGSLAWQLGIAPQNLAAVDFRRKLEDRAASSYGFSATALSGETVEAPMSDLFGREWGLGFFKPNACEFCDDVVGELSDISIGDAWLPKYVNDAQGTNVIIARTSRASDLIAAAQRNGRLSLEPLSAKDAYESQAGGFRYRREGLALRLWLKDRARLWRPKKRVTPRHFQINLIRRQIYQTRAEISALSHRAFALAKARNDFALFPAQMAAPIAKYRKWQRAEYYWNRIKEKLRIS